MQGQWLPGTAPCGDVFGHKGAAIVSDVRGWSSRAGQAKVADLVAISRGGDREGEGYLEIAIGIQE
jgi:hypothetical protein